MATINKTPVAGQNVRFWMLRREAIGIANIMTSASQCQHNVKSAEGYGWLIKNVVNNKYYDVDGVLPAEVVTALDLK